MDKSFSSWKFQIIRTLIADTKLSQSAKLVGICILRHINEQSKITYLSDETIGDEMGGLSRCRVLKARQHLREEGWLIWKRKKDSANTYRILDRNISAILDDQTQKKDLREERRANRDVAKTIQTKPPVSIVSDTNRCIENATNDCIGNDALTLTKTNTLSLTPKE
jgi:biotin operon repressor